MLGLLLQGKSYSVVVGDKEAGERQSSIRNPTLQRRPSLYVISAVVLLVVIAIGRLQSSSIVTASSGPLVVPQLMPDRPRPSMWYGLIPGAYQGVDGHPVIASLLFGMTIAAAAEQWLFRRLSAPGFFTGFVVYGKPLVEFGESVRAVLCKEDPVWRMVNVATWWMLVAGFAINLVWIAIAVRRRIPVQER